VKKRKTCDREPTAFGSKVQNFLPEKVLASKMNHAQYEALCAELDLRRVRAIEAKFPETVA
jgi:hypothetical protein